MTRILVGAAVWCGGSCSPSVPVPNPVPACAKQKSFVYLNSKIAAIVKKLSDSSRQLT